MRGFCYTFYSASYEALLLIPYHSGYVHVVLPSGTNTVAKYTPDITCCQFFFTFRINKIVTSWPYPHMCGGHPWRASGTHFPVIRMRHSRGTCPCSMYIKNSEAKQTPDIITCCQIVPHKMYPHSESTNLPHPDPDTLISVQLIHGIILQHILQ